MFFQLYSDYKFLYTFHKAGAHYSSRPLFETLEFVPFNDAFGIEQNLT